MRRGSGKCSTYIYHQRLRADGSKNTQTSSDEESEAEVEERRKRRATTSSVTEQQRQCPSGRYWRGTGLCGCSSASNCGWVREVWVRWNGTGASRPGAVTPRLARTPAETPGGSARVGLPGLQCSAGALLRDSFEQ
jgi:hypothetical protein